MTTRNMPPGVLRALAEMRESGDHDGADDLERRYEVHEAERVEGTPAEHAAAAVEVIAATADAEVKVIEATAEAQGEVIAAEATAEVKTGEGDDDGGDGGGSHDAPQHDHWYFK